MAPSRGSGTGQRAKAMVGGWLLERGREGLSYFGKTTACSVSFRPDPGQSGRVASGSFLRDRVLR